MKTCLYQPIFINPQAYFVFPSLYHIEKGDSFIEPANITGQLIINTLTDDPTLTPIILTVKDNNQVDFSIFAGKHIRISQYTDQGAVVLGEWLIPGEPAPVYPDWFNDSLVCWYSPRKQKLTEYDVIEAYVEDFTNWNYVKARGTVTVSQHKFIITECILNGLGIVEDVQEPYSNLTVRITGITDNQGVLITDYVNGQHQIINTITEDGIYTIEDRHHFIGFGCNFVGTCNITIEQLPTSILKDFSGNGLDAYMYGFQGKLNSGVGIYAVDFTSYSKTSVVTDVSHNTVKVVPAASNYLFVRYATTEMPAYTVNVQNLGNNVLTYQYATENGRREITLTEGINEIPESIKVENPYQVGFRVNAGTGEITITQIPDYPNQLCYSGKEYCISYNQPILTDYTVIADRTWFNKDSVRIFSSKYKDTTAKPGLFRFEWVVNNSEYTSSLGKDISVTFSDGITWQTKTSYNGKALTNLQYEDGEHLIIGDYAEKIGNYYIGCHSDFLLFNRTLNEDEINWLKENIYNIKI